MHLVDLYCIISTFLNAIASLYASVWCPIFKYSIKMKINTCYKFHETKVLVIENGDFTVSHCKVFVLLSIGMCDGTQRCM